MDLFVDQRRGIDQLRKYKVGALFMKPGTGKTRTAMELVRTVPDVDYVLWLAPYRSKQPKVPGTGIDAQIAQWGGFDCPHETLGIETLSNSTRAYLDVRARLEAARNPFVVVDESLLIKNWESIRTQRINELGQFAQYKLILNGTPLSRSLMDIWAQMEFLSPRILNMGQGRFKRTFCTTTTVTKQMPDGRTLTREWVSGQVNVEHLYSLIHHYVFEADLKLDVAKIMVDVPYHVDPKAREEYLRLKEKYLDAAHMEFRNNNIFLEMTQKMQHAYSCTPHKLEQLDAVMAKHDPARVLIFCKYVDSRETCAARYPKATVLSIQSDTKALNLQDKNVSVIFDKTWDYALIDQLVYRTYRTGQQEDCTYYSLTGNVPLEGLMDRNVKRKMSLLEYFNGASINTLRQDL